MTSFPESFTGFHLDNPSYLIPCFSVTLEVCTAARGLLVGRPGSGPEPLGLHSLHGAVNTRQGLFNGGKLLHWQFPEFPLHSRASLSADTFKSSHPES